MGKCDTTTAAIGIKILLSDLIRQITETNFEQIKLIMRCGFISDENDSFNDMYGMIIHSKQVPENYLEFKTYMEEQFKMHGDYIYYRNGTSHEDLSHGCLFDKHLLFPMKRILETDRWGYDRYGTNGLSCSIDFDLSVNMENYRELENYTIVFMLKHSAY